jgi:N6-L-threonylcarbamoyladenine synthase
MKKQLAPLTILAIDTSCDDTSAAVVRGNTVLSNVIFSQDEIHADWGGVVPHLARMAHSERIDGVVCEALARAHTPLQNIDAVAVTYGPGLAIALEIGIKKAKELVSLHKKPLIPVNHMRGHLFANYAIPKTKRLHSIPSSIPFPHLALLVSGKHTECVLADKSGFTILGQTRDDAMGEAFDKTARLLGLGYPGGALLSKLAQSGDPLKIQLPIPLHRDKTVSWSFSGLKTAVYRVVEELKEQRSSHTLTQEEIANVAAAFERASIIHITEKMQIALDQSHPNALILGGGAAANIPLRKALRKLAKKANIPFFTPYTKKLCRDNAAMIGVAAWNEILQNGLDAAVCLDHEKLDRDPNLQIDRSWGA